MEKNEFVDLLDQITSDASSSTHTRLTLVRTFENFFPKKILAGKYLDIKSIPVSGNYRFVVSRFNKSEYEIFRSYFSNDLNFLFFSYRDLDGILSVSNHSGYFLSRFRAGGNGSISLKSTPDHTGQSYLLNEIRNAIINEIFPYEMRLSNLAGWIDLSTDLNIRINGQLHPHSAFIFDLAKHIIDIISPVNDRIIAQKIKRNLSSGTRSSQILPVTFRLSERISGEKVIELVNRSFLCGKIEESVLGSSFYVFGSTFSAPFCRITKSQDHVKLISLPGASLDDIAAVIDNLNDAGRMIDDRQ